MKLNNINFRDSLLIISIVFLITLYYYQNDITYKIKLAEDKIKEEQNNKNNNVSINTNKQLITSSNPQKNLLYFPNGKDRVVGPVSNFHYNFKPQIKELGWRNWWSKHKCKDNVTPTNNFKDITTYNFLSGLDSVKNPYV